MNEKTQNPDRYNAKPNMEKEDKKEVKEKQKAINPSLTLLKTKPVDVSEKVPFTIPEKNHTYSTGRFEL